MSVHGRCSSLQISNQLVKGRDISLFKVRVLLNSFNSCFKSPRLEYSLLNGLKMIIKKQLMDFAEH